MGKSLIFGGRANWKTKEKTRKLKNKVFKEKLEKDLLHKKNSKMFSGEESWLGVT